VSDHTPGAGLDATLREFARGQKVFGRYTLIKILGQGGMGIVWLARDEELEREVALKFLPDVIVHDRALLDELKRETRRSLELTHKNIVRIHDFVFNETSGCISMEYVDGETLANLRAEKEQKVFEPNDIANWTSQLCDALDYAHNQARIVHRDLKPANLMVNRSGDLKVSDFGIARNLGDTASRLTMEQGRSGTLAYMSPQQLNGERGTHLDDIYSLGATLYDLLTSKPPFYSGNLDRQIHDRVAPSMTERRKDLNIEPASVPATWEEVVAACLAKDPGRRPQSTAEVAQRLQLDAPRRGWARPITITRQKKKALAVIAIATLFVVGLAGLYFGVLKRHGKPVTAPAAQTAAIPEKSIAVLPFENMSAEKDDAFFADGIQDDILATLGKIQDLKVIGRASVMIYRGAAIAGKLREIGQALQVSHVLEGSVRRSASRVVVNVELIDTRNDKQVWSQRYDRTLTDTLSLQGELAVEIARELRATLTPQEKERVEARPTTNTAAYEAYLRGRAFGSGVTPDRLRAEGAVQSYQEAVKLDPDFALAWDYLSCAQSSFYWSAFDPSPARLAAAKDALDHAVALAPDLPETHLALGYYRYYGKRDFTGALAEFQQAEQGLPNNVDIVYAIGLIQRRLGHLDEVTAAMRRVVELDPRNIDAYTVLALNYTALRRFPDALGVTNNLLVFDPTNATALGLKAYALFAMGNLDALDSVIANPGANAAIRGEVALKRRRYTEAVEILTKGLSEKPAEDKRGLLFMLGLAQQHAGNMAAARAAYQELAQECQRELEKTAPDSYPTLDLHTWLGHAYAGLGDAASAVAEGQKAMAIDPTSSDPFEGPGQEESMAEIYAMLGDADHAIPILQRLIKIPSYTAITPTMLRISTIWDPIRNDPRFQELVAEKKP
jgi:serine/threonine protein kinase/tetratricopeptide (TPR) repeat protein